MQTLLVAVLLSTATTPQQEACYVAFWGDLNVHPEVSAVLFEQSHRHVAMTLVSPGETAVIDCYFRDLSDPVPELVQMIFSTDGVEGLDAGGVEEGNRLIWKHFQPAD